MAVPMVAAVVNSSEALRLLRIALAAGTCFDPGGTGATEDWDLEASVLVAAFMDPPSPAASPRRLCLRGARVVDELDLSGVNAPFPIVFERCTFDRPLQLTGASLTSLRIQGGNLGGLEASQGHFTGDLMLGGGVTVAAAVRLRGAKVDGALDVTDATLGGDAEVALDCRGATVGANLVLGAKTALRSALLLNNAHIKGNLGCSASVAHPKDLSIDANLLQVDGNVTFDRDYSCTGTVGLVGAKIGGELHFSGGAVTKGTGVDYAIDGECLSVAQNFNLDGHLTLDGSVNVPFARLGAQLCLNDVVLRACESTALNGQGAEVEGDVVIAQGSEVFGCVDFTGAIIKGDLVCERITLRNSGGNALMAERADIGGTVFLRDIKAWGGICAMGTKIGGDLDLRGAEIHNAGGDGLLVRRAYVERDVLLTGGFVCEGTVDLVRIVIGGSLRCDEATFTAPGRTALYLRGGRIGGIFRLLPKTKPDGEVDLLDAQCAVLLDKESTWPETLVLDGFSYGCYDPEAPQKVEERLRWLARNKGGYSSRIFEQLIAVLRAGGNEEQAREVALERQRQKTRRLPVYVRPLYWIWGLTVGYGYSLRRLFPWLGALLAGGTVLFWATYPAAFTAKSTPTPEFNPFVYTLDLLVPVIKLGQSDAWVTSGAALYVGWIFTVVGWGLAIAIVAGLSQIVRKS